ncbi:MAG: hypothetical protein J6S69_09390, partial [Proteobacteria bacterium]|nr:hypothetical protein [Pseudomonadota bacterium]
DQALHTSSKSHPAGNKTSPYSQSVNDTYEWDTEIPFTAKRQQSSPISPTINMNSIVGFQRGSNMLCHKPRKNLRTFIIIASG